MTAELFDDFQSSRSPDNSYRAAPLRGLFAHMKGGFYHDGRFATWLDVVNHYNSFKKLSRSEKEKREKATSAVCVARSSIRAA